MDILDHIWAILLQTMSNGTKALVIELQYLISKEESERCVYLQEQCG